MVAINNPQFFFTLWRLGIHLSTFFSSNVDAEIESPFGNELSNKANRIRVQLFFIKRQ